MWLLRGRDVVIFLHKIQWFDCVVAKFDLSLRVGAEASAVLEFFAGLSFQARFFALHALVNAIVTTTAIPDTVRTALNPVASMQGACNVVPA